MILFAPGEKKVQWEFLPGERSLALTLKPQAG
jgi:hypothetical protein